MIRRKFTNYYSVAGCVCMAITWSIDAAAATAERFHHHVHNFSVDIWNKNNPDYALAHLHAKEMGYSLVSSAPATGIPTDDLGFIKLHNAYYAPARLDFDSNRILYFDYYSGSGKQSLIRPDRQVSKWYPIDQLDLRILKVFGCAKRDVDTLALNNFNFDTAKEYFFLDWIEGGRTNLVANLTSKWVVARLIETSMVSFEQTKDAALFFDDLAHRGKPCANAAAGNAGSFPDWKSGQKYWVEQVVRQVKQLPGVKRWVFGNIWDPNDSEIGKTYMKWYADGTLRLDHYYYEAGPQKNRNTAASKDENGVYQYVSPFGYLPAELVSISTTYGYYGTRVTRAQHDGYLQGRKGYLLNTLEVAGIAAKQGSWFGWYGSNNLDRRELLSEKEIGSLVHTNDLQLLRAIPGWDNLASIPLENRTYDGNQKVYSSPNSFFSPKVIYSRHYHSGEMFAVFKSRSGHIKLRPGETIVSAWFANHYFGKTTERAMDCLVQRDDIVTLACENAIDRGIRINLATASNRR